MEYEKTTRYSAVTRRNRTAMSGLWLRGKTWWFHWTPPGGKKRVRISLETGDIREAYEKAKKFKADPSKIEAVLPGDWSEEIEKYIEAMLSRKEFTASSAESSESFLKAAARRLHAGPGELDVLVVQSFYDSLAVEGLRPTFTKTPKKPKKGEEPPPPEAPKKAGPLTDYSRATYLARLSGFCDWMVDGNKLQTNPCGLIKKAKVRVVSKERACNKVEVQKLIKACARKDLKFVLLCGFHAGMRKQEIVNAKPHWFNLQTGVLSIPDVDGEFRSKNEKRRFIQMSKTFISFLKNEYGKWQVGDWMLHPECHPLSDKKVGKGIEKKKKRYRYDPRRPFEEFMEDQNFPWVSMHTMRHTFCTLLAPTVPSIVLAAAVGDTVRTIETHYYHAPASGVETAGALD